jgi:hypothetical protein
MGVLYIVTLFIQCLYTQWKKMSRPFTYLHVRSLKWGGIHFSGSLLVSGVLLVACSGPILGGNAAPTVQGTTTANQVPLSSLHWCGKPLVVFRDEGTSATTAVQGATPTTAAATATPASSIPSTPKTIDDWQQVKANLGFTVFLPATLPAGTCLVNASATIHDSIFGGNFTIGYLLPDHSALSLSEAPLRSQNTAFQCSPSSTTGATKTAGSAKNIVQLCSGARTTTHIVFSALGTTPTLEQFFRHLQPDPAWMPA